jgi:drug/metabolite transporter (DMT)-like permease
MKASETGYPEIMGRVRQPSPASVAGTGAGMLAGLVWGLAFLLPVLLTGWGAVAITVGRYLAYGALSLILVVLGGATPRATARRHWRPALTFALTGNVCYYLLLVLGIALVGAPVTDIIIGSIPVTIALVGNVVSATYPWRRLLLPVALVLVGLLIVNVLELGGAAPTQQTPVVAKVAGVLAAFGAVALWTWYGIANARFLSSHPDVPSAGWSTVVGLGTGAVTLLVVPLAAVTGQLAPTDPEAGIAPFLIASLVLGVLVSWVATVLWNLASARLSTTAAGMLINIETVAGFGYVYAARGQWPPIGQVIGFALVLVGVLLVVRLPEAEPTARDELVASTAD